MIALHFKINIVSVSFSCIKTPMESVARLLGFALSMDLAHYIAMFARLCLCFRTQQGFACFFSDKALPVLFALQVFGCIF